MVLILTPVPCPLSDRKVIELITARPVPNACNSNLTQYKPKNENAPACLPRLLPEISRRQEKPKVKVGEPSKGEIKDEAG